MAEIIFMKTTWRPYCWGPLTPHFRGKCWHASTCAQSQSGRQPALMKERPIISFRKKSIKPFIISQVKMKMNKKLVKMCARANCFKMPTMQRLWATRIWLKHLAEELIFYLFFFRFDFSGYLEENSPPVNDEGPQEDRGITCGSCSHVSSTKAYELF